jgi:hypothetical protein
VEVYKLPVRGNSYMPAELVLEKRVAGETVTGMVVGNVTSSSKREVLISCYSGAIMTLVDRRHAKRMGTLTEDAMALTEDQAKKEKEYNM